MEAKWNANELYYRQILSSIGIAMLCLLLFMNAFGLLFSAVQFFLRMLVPQPMMAEIVEQLFYAAGYLLVFMLPAAVLRWTISKKGLRYRPMKAELRISRWLPVIVLGGVLLIWVQSYLNSAMVSVFNYQAFSSEVLWERGEMRYGYQIVLQFIVMALVPAFCEEFLFRGAVLTNLLPFGRVPAILISSLLFAMMHQNAEQILYAFAAGILFGVIYERSGSIWNCFFLHLFNNFASFALEIAASKLDRDQELGWAIAETALCVVCIGCTVLLVRFLAPEDPNTEDGIFGRSVPVSDSYAEYPVSPSKLIRLFFNVPMILFFALTALQIVLLILMAWGYGYVA